jgi:2-polyprenyl-3-methyl-5-hydroxy-6-metoxy-1,4-benzoquinol methylase
MSIPPAPTRDPLTPPPLTPARRRERAHLLSRIHRRYQTVTEPRAIGASSLAFTRIADPDVVLDEVVEECDRIERDTGVRLQDPLHLPYWAELWDSAAGVGWVLMDRAGAAAAERKIAATNSSAAGAGPARPNVYDMPGRSVLDLGCGMGLSGTICAALGANVLMADLETPALLFARLNSLPWAARVRTRRLNWQTDRLAERFDLIVGADILYERSQWEFLDDFWRAHLAPGGELVLGEPGRQTGDTFLSWAPERGWGLERVDRKVPTRETPVRILRLWAK